jgi:phage N-6-adenine-methyltransferase
MRTALNVMTMSVKHDWKTPKKVLDLVRKMGPIILDPATSDDNPVGAAFFYTKEANGLAQDWKQDPGLVFCNPPYGREIKDWAAKFACEGSMNGVELIALLPARTDTKWWHNYIKKSADAYCFWEGRLAFSDSKDVAPFPSVLVYWGDRVELFKEIFGPYGWCP